MATNEPSISRTIRGSQGQTTGTRVAEGTIEELLAAVPDIGVRGHHPWNLRLIVTENFLESTDFGEDGAPRGKLTTSYGFGSPASRTTEERQNGWREDELDISEVDSELTHDIPGEKILIPKWNEDENFWELIPGEITARDTTAVWRVHLVTDTIFAHLWTEKRGTVNSEKFAEAVPGLWLFDGAKTFPLPYRDSITNNILYDVELVFLLNLPGWNINQFGITPDMKDASGNPLPVHDYFIYPDWNFHSLFPMLLDNPDYPLIFHI